MSPAAKKPTRIADTDLGRIDPSKARGIYESLASTVPLSRIVFKGLATGERPRLIQDVTRFRLRLMKEGAVVAPQDLLDIYRKLQKEGYGVLVMPNSPTEHIRFHWRVNNVKFGRVALGMSDTPPAGTTVPANRMRTSFPIRGELVTLDLPKDMTKKEATELAEFIRRFGR